MTKKTKKKPTWVWIYGDEFDELWEHFGMTVRNDGQQWQDQKQQTSQK